MGKSKDWSKCANLWWLSKWSSWSLMYVGKRRLASMCGLPNELLDLKLPEKLMVLLIERCQKNTGSLCAAYLGNAWHLVTQWEDCIVTLFEKDCKRKTLGPTIHINVTFTCTANLWFGRDHINTSSETVFCQDCSLFQQHKAPWYKPNMVKPCRHKHKSRLQVLPWDSIILHW